MQATTDATQLLVNWGQGDRSALDRLLPMVYDELRRLAASYLRRERPDHTLQPTALVHEAYVRLLGQHAVDWHNRAQFFGIAAQMMRRVLVNHARDRHRLKRGGAAETMPLDDALGVAAGGHVDFTTLDDALVALEKLDPQQARIVELRFFGGLTIEEAADVLKISPATLKREFRSAKAWLHNYIETHETMA